MIAPPIPHNEVARCQALRGYRILNTKPEAVFDELAELVAVTLNVPIALISFVDEKRQWHKSRYGLGVSAMPREQSVCAHTLLEDKVTVVEDGRDDIRFADNPLVTGDSRLRFYAGAPLLTPDGYAIGTVCAIDHRPRKISAEQIRTLEIIAKQVLAQLYSRKSLLDNQRLLEQQQSALERAEINSQDVQDLVSVISHDLRAPVLNVAGFAEELEAGATALARCINNCPTIAKTMRHDMQTILDDDVIDSVVHLKRGARQLIERVDAITSLSKYSRRDIEAEEINLVEMVRDIVDCHSNELRTINATVNIDVCPVAETDRLSLQILLENLVANAIKYREPSRGLVIDVRSIDDPECLRLEISDNGRGIHDDDISRIFMLFRRVGKQDTTGDGTGLAFCRAICDRLGGSLTCESVLGEGAVFTLRLPKAQRDVLIGQANTFARTDFSHRQAP